MPLPKEKVLKQWKVTIYPKPKTYTVHSERFDAADHIAKQNYQSEKVMVDDFYRSDITDMDEVNSWPENVKPKNL